MQACLLIIPKNYGNLFQTAQNYDNCFQTVFYFCLINRFRKLKEKDLPELDTKEDQDVTNERDRIKSGSSRDLLQLKDLTKFYSSIGSKGKFLAVNRLHLGVPQGEVGREGIV